jgi:uncharacterized SAM-dependent methyltransferase
MEFNPLVFKELLKRGYSLEGKTKVWNIADSKLWDLTPEQTDAYLNLAANEEYESMIGKQGKLTAMSWPKELPLLQENMKQIINGVDAASGLNIIDLGCGNGNRAALLIENMKGKIKKIRYCPIDISGHMAEKALEHVEKMKVAEVARIKWNLSDLENLDEVSPLLRKTGYKQNLFLLLGNTLGNFEMHELLYEVRKAMKEGDVLLIGNGLDNHQVEGGILKACKGNQGIAKFLSYVPLQIGLANEDLEYDARFKNSRIEFFFTVKKEKTVEFDGQKVRFNKGDKLIVAMTYHYEKEDFSGYLTMYFGEVEVSISGDGSYALALCRK